MRCSIVLVFLAFTALFVKHAVAQNGTATAPTLVEQLLGQIDSPNEVFQLLFGPSILSAQTPLAVRYFLLISAAGHEITAACDPVVLSFFGTKDPIAKEFCGLENFTVINSYLAHRMLKSQFPVEGGPYGRFLSRLGLDPFSESRDTRTMTGWANFYADRLLEYFDNDGWNAQGDATRDDYRQQYSDPTNYHPQNPAFLSPSKLRRPLRWQPLTAEVDGKGNFASQVHVVPHIASKAKPLVVSPPEFRSKRVSGPYASPNRKGTIAKADEKVMLNQIQQLFKLSSEITTKDVALSYWWENKFISLGVIIPYYQRVLNLDALQSNRLFLGEMLAQHDAILLAWKEKVRHDLVRPPTMIRRLLKGKMVQAYRGFGKGVGMVKAEEWEPVVKVQPHSEFPSASAVICQASADHLELALNEMIGNGTIPAYEQTLEPVGDPLAAPNSPVDVPVDIRFNTLQEAAKSCGQSRLTGGVHFAAAVPAGFELAAGVGEAAYEHMRALYAGEIPKNCARCLRK